MFIINRHKSLPINTGNHLSMFPHCALTIMVVISVFGDRAERRVYCANRECSYDGEMGFTG